MVTAKQMRDWIELLRVGARLTCEPARTHNIGRVIGELEAALVTVPVEPKVMSNVRDDTAP